MDGAKDVRTSSSDRAPPTEMVEDTRKNMIFSFHKKINKYLIAAFRHDFLLSLIVRLRRFLWRYFNEKCPECIIGMRELNSSLLAVFSSLSHKTDALSLSIRH